MHATVHRPLAGDGRRRTYILVHIIAALCLLWPGASSAAEEERISDDTCLECHGDKDLTMEKDGKEISIFVDGKKLRASVHGEKQCAECHKDLTDEHPDDEKRAAKVDCAQCHEKQSASFGASVHGLAARAGNEAAATCTDCHGTHEVFAHGSEQSSTHFKKLLGTCGGCHEQEAEDVAASIHGKATSKGILETPTCIHCHEEHKIGSLAGGKLARTVGDTCGGCHQSERINTKFGMPGDRVKTFFDSYHGLALKGGSANAANCASCHGYHKILPSTDPESTIHKDNLVDTCGHCHPGAGANFTSGPIHMFDDVSGGTGAVVNHWVRVLYIGLIIVVIGSMLVHNFLSWMRALKEWYHARGDTAVRMNLHQRMQHFVLVASFIILALSGFALKFPESWLGWLFGSDEAIRRWVHRAAGVVMLGGGAWHLVYLVATRDGRKLARDFTPRVEDLRHIVWNLMYFTGKRREPPRFRRFGYVEKSEYWAVVWGTVIMGITGLMIWLKMDVTRWFPRWLVDVATTIHYYEAILACLAIVVWHFYHVLFAPGTYPMNFAWWDGKVSRKWLEEEHPLDPETGKESDGQNVEK